MKTLETIKKNNDTRKFAEHFATKNSIKNLLQGVQGAKVLSVIIENEQYAKEILGYSNVTEQLDSVLSDVFEKYTEQVDAWKSAGETRSLPKRVLLFRDLVYEGLENSPAFGATLGDFSKTVSGKEIETVLKDNGFDNGEILLGVLTLIAVRSFINKIMSGDTEDVVEKVEGEVIEPFSHHTSEKTGTEEEPPKEETTKKTVKESTEIDNIFKNGNSEDIKNHMKKLLDSVMVNKDITEFERMLTVAYPYLRNNINVISKMVNSINVVPNDTIKRLVSVTLPNNHIESIRGFNIDKLINIMSSKTDTTDEDIYGAVLTFHTCVNAIDNLDDINKFKESIMNLMNLFITEDITKSNLKNLIDKNEKILKAESFDWAKSLSGYGNVSAEIWLNDIIKKIEKGDKTSTSTNQNEQVKEVSTVKPSGIVTGGIFGSKGCGRPNYAGV